MYTGEKAYNSLEFYLTRYLKILTLSNRHLFYLSFLSLSLNQTIDISTLLNNIYSLNISSIYTIYIVYIFCLLHPFNLLWENIWLILIKPTTKTHAFINSIMQHQKRPFKSTMLIYALCFVILFIFTLDMYSRILQKYSHNFCTGWRD